MSIKKIKLLPVSAVTLLLLSCGRSDKAIETDVSVSVHPSAPDITVSSRNAVVTLSGLVKDSASWRATIKAANSTAGVKEVVDQLHIAPPKPVTPQ